MSEPVVLDEFHIAFRIPANLSEKKIKAARKVIDSKIFQARLETAIRRLLARYPSLNEVTVELSR